MKHYKYLIVGGGIAADAAAKAVRKIDVESSIGMLADEPDLPYRRPLLSKQLWKGRPIESVWLKTEAQGVSVHLSCGAASIDPKTKQVTDEHGEVYGYDKLLIATGGSPRRLPFGEDHIIYFRSLRDYYELAGISEHHERFLILGAGFTGSELAGVLTEAGKRVTMVFPEPLIGDRVFPKGLCERITRHFEDKGVTVYADDVPVSVERDGDGLLTTTRDGRRICSDGVVAGLGMIPNTQIAEQAGLEVSNGITTNEFLQTSEPDIFAAGDVANFNSSVLGKRIRVEHVDNAVAMGRCAGEGMAGQLRSYCYVPYFYADMFDLSYKAVGEMDSKLEIIEDWKEPYESGVLYYCNEGKVCGVLFWNTKDRLDDARALMAEQSTCPAGDLLGRLT